MTWRLTTVSIAIASIFLAGWFVFNSPAGLELKAASPDGDAAAFGSILYQAATTTPVPPTAVPPTATPVPPPTSTPAPTPIPAGSGTRTSLPVIPIFLGVMFLGLVLAVSIPVIRSRIGRR